MPRFRTHAEAGAVAGALAAAVAAPDAVTGNALVAEIIGGVIGGLCGGVVPDMIEPAHHPGHRKIAHSLFVGGVITLARVSEWQARCRSTAAMARARADSCLAGTPERVRAEWDEFVWWLLAGALAGLTAGYASHLALDALTPRGLPILGV